MSSISYLITVSNETETLKNLLETISFICDENDEIVVLQDEKFYDNTSETDNIINEYWKKYASDLTMSNSFLHLKHPLNNNYSEHKNWGMAQCKKDYIFQIDGDECPTETLALNVKEIIKLNPHIEAFWISRINDFKGVTSEHANRWGWQLIMSHVYNRPLVNWPDPQCRLIKNKPEIKWSGKLHERITGNKNFVFLPPTEELALYHDKTIEKQIETNLRYNKEFTENENKGFMLPSR